MTSTQVFLHHVHSRKTYPLSMWNCVRCVLFFLLCSCFFIKSSNTIATPRVNIIPESEGNFIFFNSSNASRQPYIASINSFMSTYDKANEAETVRNCDFNYPPPENSVCTFDTNSLRPCSQLKEFGFDKNSPCLFFTLSQVLNWIPVVLNGSDVQRHSDRFLNVPHHLNSTIAQNDSENSLEKYVWFSCDGEEPEDKEFIGSITYYPRKGFPTYYFPFRNINGYQSPIVAVHFEHPQRGVAISVVCKIWAKNIQLNQRNGVGFVKFLLLVD